MTIGSKEPNTPSGDSRFPAIYRGGVMTKIIDKQLAFIGFADRRAYNLIAINSVIIPVALAKIADPAFQLGVIVSMATAMICIFLSILSLFPKPYQRGAETHDHLLHFSSMLNYSEKEYTKKFGELIAVDDGRIGEAVAQDIYNLSKNVIAPKFRLLRASFLFFFAGHLIALIVILSKAT